MPRIEAIRASFQGTISFSTDRLRTAQALRLGGEEIARSAAVVKIAKLHSTRQNIIVQIAWIITEPRRCRSSFQVVGISCIRLLARAAETESGESRRLVGRVGIEICFASK
jgi:hypothetical protein